RIARIYPALSGKGKDSSPSLDGICALSPLINKTASQSPARRQDRKEPVRPVWPSGERLVATRGEHMFLTVSVAAWSGLSLGSLAIGLRVRHQRPGDARILIGQRHTGLEQRAPALDRGHPPTARITLGGRSAHDRPGPVDQQRAQVAIPPLAD